MRRLKTKIGLGRVLCVFLALSSPFLTGIISTPRLEEKPAGEGINASLDELMYRVLELNRQGQHKQAIDLLSVAIKNDKENALLRTLLMQTFDLFLESEIKLGQEQIAKDATNVDAYLRVSSGLDLAGDRFNAAGILLRGIFANETSASLWMAIAKMELKSGRNNEALDVFREVIRLDDKNPDALNNAAFLLSTRVGCDDQDLLQAERYAKNARDLDPTNAQYIDTLAEVQFKKGNQDLALSLIKEAIRLAPQEEEFKSQLKRFSLRPPINMQ